MTDTKLPTEAELDAIKLDWLTPPERETVERLIALGRAYYAQQRALREWVSDVHAWATAIRLQDDGYSARGTAERLASEIEALLGEGGS